MTAQTEVKAVPQEHQKDWAKPKAMAIPKEGYFKFEQGKYGPVFPRTPACHGFTLIAKIKPGREEAFREHGKTIEKAVESDPYVLAPLKLHYLRWLLFDIGKEIYFMYQGIFDTDFDRYTDDAVAIFSKIRINYGLREPGRISRRLEDEPVGVRANNAAYIGSLDSKELKRVGYIQPRPILGHGRPPSRFLTLRSWFDHDRRLPERSFLRVGTPYRNLAGILARLKIGQRNTEAQRNRF